MTHGSKQQQPLFVISWRICAIFAIMVFLISYLFQLFDSSSTDTLADKTLICIFPILLLLTVIIALFKRDTIETHKQELIDKPHDYFGWNLELVQQLNNGDFSTLSAEILKSQDKYALFVPTKIAGNADIGLFSKDEPEKLIAIARCKANNGLLGIVEVSSLYSVMVAREVDNCYFITNNSFTREAKKYAESLPMTLIDGQQILSIIEGFEDRQSQQLLQVVTTNKHSL